MNILEDDIFHSCALAAYCDVFLETGIFPPDMETTRKRAYKYYENELRNRGNNDSDI